MPAFCAGEFGTTSKASTPRSVSRQETPSSGDSKRARWSKFRSANTIAAIVAIARMTAPTLVPMATRTVTTLTRRFGFILRLYRVRSYTPSCKSWVQLRFQSLVVAGEVNLLPIYDLGKQKVRDPAG